MFWPSVLVGSPILLTSRRFELTDYSTIEIDFQTTDDSLSPKDTLDLRNRFLRLGVARADFGAAKEVPEGAKAGEILTLATITLALLPLAYPDVVKLLKEWMGLSKDRRVKIRKRNADKEVEIEYNLGDVNIDQMRELMEMLEKEVE